MKIPSAAVQEERIRTFLPPEEVNLGHLVSLLWRGRLLVTLVTIGFTAITVAAALVSTKEYEARVVIMPAERDSRDSSLGATLTQLGSLAALAGLSPSVGDAKAEALATLQSDIVTETYIRQQNLLPVLFPRKWDSVRHAWRATDRRDWPTVWQANDYFSKHVRAVTDDRKDGLIILSIYWRDPAVAAKWANDLVALTNDHMRQLAIEDAERNMAYLQEQVQKTNNVEMKNTIYTLMQGELKSAMLAQGNRQFALKVIDPATPPEKPISPKPLVWGIEGFLGGFLASALYLVAKRGLANARELGDSANPDTYLKRSEGSIKRLRESSNDTTRF